MEEIYIWLEGMTGSSPAGYEDDFRELVEDPNIPFMDTFKWKNMLSNILDTLSDVLDDVDEYAPYIPEELPDCDDMKLMISSYVMGNILTNINIVKKRLGLITNPNQTLTYTSLITTVNVLSDLIDMVKQNSMDDISSKSLFDKYNNENDDQFIEVLELSKTDIPNIWETVSSIIEVENADNE